MTRIYTVNGVTYQHTAWTGGDSPASIGGRYYQATGLSSAHLFRAFNAIRCAMYRDQLKDWGECWGDTPDLDTRLIYWGRATFDAWRTITDGRQ